MPEPLTALDIARRSGLALAMACFAGLAFEGVYKHDERTSPGGIRTFPMLAALGIVLYLLDPRSLLPWLLGAVSVGLWLYAYLRQPAPPDSQKPGLVVPTVNLLAYTLGPVAFTQPAWIVVAVAVIAVLLLESRDALHRLVSNVPSDEVFTLGKFLILVGIVLPLLPDRPVVAWTPITPFKAWLALVTISTLSYASYLLQRYLPARESRVLLPAILGGAYSSTATTVALARQHRALSGGRDLEVGIILATAMMYIRIDAVVAVFNVALALTLLPALAGLLLLAVIVAVWHSKRYPPETSSSGTKLPAQNPLQLGTAATFAGLYIALAVASTWVEGAFGRRGVYALAAASGLTDIDPFVLNLAQGGVAGMSVQALAAAILFAASANNVFKACCALFFGGARALLRPACVLLGLAAAGFGVALLY